MSRRTERVSEEIRAEIARNLRESMTDPRLRLVTLTRVDVSPDLSRADVFWSVVTAKGTAGPLRTDPAEPLRTGSAEREEAELALEHAAGFLRRRLAAALPLRRMPSLHFHYDPSLALGSETLAVLRDLRRDDEE